MRTGGNHIGLPLHNGVFVGADLCVCPDSHVEIILRRHLPSARAEFMIAPLLQVPPASRGEPRTGSVPPARRGTLKEGGIGHTRFCELGLRDW